MPFICHDRPIGHNPGILKGVGFFEWKANTELQRWAGLSFQRSPKESFKPSFLALHGWLDNAASFVPLVEALQIQNFLSLDLPGHGKSAWRKNQISYAYLDWIVLLHNLFIRERWSQVTLVGHSLGGSIAAIFAGLFPEFVKQLVLIDSFGPVIEASDEVKNRLRKFCIEHESPVDKVSSHESFLTLVRARARSPVSPLSLGSSETLMKRGAYKSGSLWKIRSDPKLRLPGSIRLSLGQAEALLNGLSCPTLILRNKTHQAHKYWSDYEPVIRSCPQLRLVDMEGGHHLHMENVKETAQHIRSFLGKAP